MVALRVAMKVSGFGAFDPKHQYINEDRREVARNIEAVASKIAEQIKVMPSIAMTKHRHVIFSCSYRNRLHAGRREFNVMSRSRFMYVVSVGGHNPMAIDMQGRLYYQLRRRNLSFKSDVYFWKAFGDIAKSTLETSVLKMSYLRPLEAWLAHASMQNT
jgi:creatinine amidohydrolase/Fe(II)-dependent formamide hydrolase-like protein